MTFRRNNRAGACCLFFLAIVMFLWSCSRPTVLPSRLDHIPADLAKPGLELSGIYQDGWGGETASLLLQQPTGDQLLTVRGMVPKIGDGEFRSQVEVRIDDSTVGRQSVGTGEFQLSLPVAPGAGRRRITIAMSPLQQLPGGDGRMVGARLDSIGFEAPPTGAASPVDILKVSGAELGTGWGIVETFRKETFRWVENDAQIQFPAWPAQDVELSVVVEPGPGVGQNGFLLKVLDPSGKQVAASNVLRRSMVKFFLPVEPGKPSAFRLHVDGGGRPAPKDPRILNFRVFQITAEPLGGHAK